MPVHCNMFGLFFVYLLKQVIISIKQNINKIKVVLAEKQLTNKWLAEQLGKDQGTVSKWCTNTIQPKLETLVEIAKCLNVELKDLLRPINEQ